MEKKVKDLIDLIVRVDNLMEPVYKITKKRQLIIFNKEYPFKIQSKLEAFFKGDSRYSMGCLSIRMANCTVRIYRSPDQWHKSKNKAR